MFVGHAALAMVIKTVRPRISLPILLAAAYGPDILEGAVGVLGRGLNHTMLSHSLPSVAIMAALSGVAYAAATRRAGDAAVVGLMYASHWPADFITGLKPTWPGGPDVGLQLYGHPVADMMVESGLLVMCWLIYRRRRSLTRVDGPMVIAGLILAQGVFDLFARSVDLHRG
jgi:hypothetical protein